MGVFPNWWNNRDESLDIPHDVWGCFLTDTQSDLSIS